MPRTLPQPNEPSAEARVLHSYFHTPFAAWCKICVAAKSKDDSHYKLGVCTDDLPLVEFDYSVLASDVESTDKQNCLVGLHVQSGYGFAFLVMTKGVADTLAVRMVLKWLVCIGLTGKMPTYSMT